MEQFKFIPTSQRLFFQGRRVPGIIDPNDQTYTYDATASPQMIAESAFRAGRLSASVRPIPVVDPVWAE